MSLRTTPAQAGVDYQAVEDAIQKWFRDATGVDVLWSDQDIPQPEWPYGTLNAIDGPDKIGGEDNVRLTTDLTQAGQEVQQEHNGPRQMIVSCQVIQGPPDTHNPDCHARRLATGAQAALSLDSINAAFNAVGLAVVEVSSLTSIPVDVGGEKTSRSIFDVTFAFTSSVTERVGYIENATIIGTIDDSGALIIEDFSTNN